MAFGNSDVGAVHCLAEAVGCLYDTAHGVANSVLLPTVMEFKLPASAGRYANITRIAGITGGYDTVDAQKLITLIKDFCRSLGVSTFREIGIREEEFPEIAQKSFENNSNPSNPKEANTEDCIGIPYRALSG